MKTFWRPLIWLPPQTPGLDPPLPPIEYTLYWKFFHRSRFESNLRLPWKFSLFWIHFVPFRILSNFALALKNRVALHSLYWIYFLHSGFEQLALALKYRVCPDISLNWAYFLHSGYFSNLRLPWNCAAPPPRTPMFEPNNIKPLLKLTLLKLFHILICPSVSLAKWEMIDNNQSG